MPFYQLDDQLTHNAKYLALTDGTGQAFDAHGWAALGLWAAAGTLAQANLSDGRVSRRDVLRLVLDGDALEDLAGRLVAVGLWHAPGHACDRCPAVEPGSWLFHDWHQFGYDTAEQIKATRARRKELKDRKVIDAVWARDCIDPGEPNTARCRYCSTVVNRHDRKSEVRPWLDHVDPSRAVGVRNLVVSCDRCNRRKGGRTPAQAGMQLQPPPRPHTQDPTAADPGATQDTAADEQRPWTPPPTRRDPLPEQRPDTAAQQRPDTAPDQQRPDTAAQQRPDPAADQMPDQTDNQLIPTGLVVSSDARRARDARGRVWEGLETGTPGGDRQGQPRRRRGRRGRRASAPPGPPTQPDQQHQDDQPPRRSQDAPAPEVNPWDAGEAPDVPAPGRFGSAWHGWHGPPPSPDVLDASTCEQHGQQLPCRQCVPSWAIEEGQAS